MPEHTANTPQGRRELREDIAGDIAERSEWRDRRLELRDQRLGARKKNLLYRGAPNFLEPIIDDNVRSVTSSENQIMWSGRFLAHFLPLTREAVELKREAEIAFHTLLQFGIDVRAKIEALLDTKNNVGMAVAKLIPNRDDYRRLMREDATIPDFEDVDPLDVIVPVGTREIKNAVRIVHVLKLSELELRKRGDRAGWRNVNEVVAACRRLTSHAHDTGTSRFEDEAGAPTMIGLLSSDPSEDLFVIWEIYFEDARGRHVAIMCPDIPELAIHNFEWEWEPIATEIQVLDQITGESITVGRAETPPKRRWPFFQFRYEGRTRDYYDVRGQAEMLEDNQKAATQYMNVRATHFDFYGFPILQSADAATGAMANFRWRPGERLPPGVQPAQMPRLDPTLDFSIDRERAAAARRVGAAQGALLSAEVPRERKTAREVSREATVQTQLTSDSVMRFAEPFSELFNEMWLWLRHNPVRLPMIDNQMQFQGISPMAVFDAPFLLMAAPNSRAANPDFILQQLTLLQPYFANNQFVDVAELTRIVTDQIDPNLTERLVLDPETQGVSGVPLVQVVQGLQGAVQQLAQQVQAQQQFLTAQIREQEVTEGGERGAAQQVAQAV